MAMAGNVHPLHMPVGAKCPDVCNAIIEIPEGSKVKYEIDKETGVCARPILEVRGLQTSAVPKLMCEARTIVAGMLFVDRVLYSSTYYPHNYGFIPSTLCDDGDALVCSYAGTKISFASVQ